ncbi:ceramide-1-phosphate transfer protein-like isoform X1 [Arapaima gigas]
MGLKWPTALRRPHRRCYFLLTAIVLLMFYLSVRSLPEETAEDCHSSWAPCWKLNSRGEQLSSPAGSDSEYRDPTQGECPGQRFQVSQLLSHLHSALSPNGDVLLQPYLSSWEELLKFMESLGPVVGFISQQVENKASLIHHLAQQDSQRQVEEAAQQEDAYRSVRSMIRAELSWGLVNFQQQTPSGCRTLLRLHRALLWLQLFLEKVAESAAEGRELRSVSELCREAYLEALAHHHSWVARQAASMAFAVMPDRDALFQLVCVQSQKEARPVLHKVAKAIGEVYHRTQRAFKEHGMLELP